MNEYAIFLDIDGTLIANGTLAEENVVYLAEAQKRGHLVFINTGRSYSFIPFDKLSRIRFDGILAGCGADLRINGERIHRRSLSDDFVKKVCEAYLKSGRTLFLEGEEACFWINPANSKKANDMLSASAYPCFEITDASQLRDVYNYPKISKLSYWGTDITQAEIDLWSEELRTICHPTYTESILYNDDKATAIERTLAYVGIDKEHTIAIGDSENDREMLEYAKISVAVGNATDKIKEICTMITDTAANGGVGKAIKELLLD